MDKPLKSTQPTMTSATPTKIRSQPMPCEAFTTSGKGRVSSMPLVLSISLWLPCAGCNTGKKARHTNAEKWAGAFQDQLVGFVAAFCFWFSAPHLPQNTMPCYQKKNRDAINHNVSGLTRTSVVTGIVAEATKIAAGLASRLTTFFLPAVRW